MNIFILYQTNRVATIIINRPNESIELDETKAGSVVQDPFKTVMLE